MSQIDIEVIISRFLTAISRDNFSNVFRSLRNSLELEATTHLLKYVSHYNTKVTSSILLIGGTLSSAFFYFPSESHAHPKLTTTPGSINKTAKANLMQALWVPVNSPLLGLILSYLINNQKSAAAKLPWIRKHQLILIALLVISLVMSTAYYINNN